MKKKINIVLLSIISLSFVTNSVFAEDVCYKANKNDFNHTPNTPHNIIFDLSELETKNWIHLSFSSLLPMPYADGRYSFYCVQKDNEPEIYECSGDDDSGKMHIRTTAGEYVYVNVKFATMTNTPDDPIFHEIRSKVDTFTSAYRTVCPKPHIFSNNQENNLPFVCYSWKGEENIDGKDKSVYNGCTQYNQICQSIGAKHFGKYQNDYEAYQAFLRCENSRPRPNSNDHTSIASEPSLAFIKNENKKQALLESINIKDVAIYDLDYYQDLVIAVGEDDSPKTRKLQSMDEYHESMMLRSTDGGKHWSKIGEPNELGVPHNSVIVLDNKRIVVSSSIEGAGGSIILSEDAGQSWETRYNEAFIESMQQIQGDTLIAKTFGPTIKSIDGGKNWVEITP